MSAFAPGEIPTFAELEAAGVDAGALMDATRRELEGALAASQDRATRSHYAQALKDLDRQHAGYFGGEA